MKKPSWAPGAPADEQRADDVLKALERATRGPDFVARGKTWRSRAVRRTVRAVWRLVRRTIRRVFARRRILSPVLIGTAAYFVGAYVSLYENGWVALLTAGGVGAFPVYWWLGLPLLRWTRRRRVKPTYQRCWYASAYVTLIVLSVLTAGWRVGVPMPGLWFTAISVYLGAWLWHHRIRHDDQPVLDDPRHQRWAQINKVNEAELGEITDLTDPDRWVADVDLTPTDMLVSDLTKHAAHIAKREGVPRANVIIDEKTPGVDTAAVLTVTLKNPIEQSVEYDDSWAPPIPCTDGTFKYHTYTDGYIGRLRLLKPKSGTTNTLFSGDVGTGKTAGMLYATLQALRTGLCHPILGDPQGGQSLPTLGGAEGICQNKATDPEQVYHQMAGVYAVSTARSEYLATYVWWDEHGDRHVGMPFFDPFILMAQKKNPLDWPILLYLLDEAHLACGDPVWGPLIIDLLENIIKLTRKTGIAVWAATQYPGVEELGNKMSVRQNLIAGNTVAYRNSATSAGNMILRDHMPSPFDIPSETPDGADTQGTAIIASAAPKSSRPAYSRTVFSHRQTKWTQVAARYIKPLDEVAGNAFADANVERAEYALAAQVQNTLASEAGAGQREQIVMQNTSKKKPTALEAAVAYLMALPADARIATTGVLADAAGVELNTMSQALGRGIPRNIVHHHEGRVGMWALGPDPDRELVGAGAAA